MPVLNSKEIRSTQIRGTVGLPPTARRTSAPVQRQPVAQKEALQKEEEGKTTYYIGDAEITEQEYKKYSSMGDREKFDFLVSKKAIPEGSEYIPPLTQSEVDYANKARQEAIDSGFLPVDAPKVDEARSWAYLSPDQVKEQKEYKQELEEWADKFVKNSEANRKAQDDAVKELGGDYFKIYQAAGSGYKGIAAVNKALAEEQQTRTQVPGTGKGKTTSFEDVALWKPKTEKQKFTELYKIQSYNLKKDQQQLYNWMTNVGIALPPRMTNEQVTQTWQSIPGKTRWQIQNYNATYKQGAKPVDVGWWGLVPFVDTVANFKNKTILANVVDISNDVITTVMIGGGIYAVGKGSIKLIARIHADETGRTLGQIFDFRNTKIGSFVNSKINRALNSTYNVQTEKAFLKRLNKVRTAQIKMEMAAGESKFAPFDVVGQDGIVRTIKFDAPAKQSRWRAILTGPSEKPYLYYTPKGEEEYLLRTGFRIREMAPVGTTKTGAAFKTGGGFSQIEPTWEIGTNYKGATKSAGLALEERLGAMTPEQAAKIRGIVYPLVAKGIPLVDVLNDPLVQEKIEPVIRQSEVTKPGTSTRTGTQISTTTSPLTSPAQKTASKTSTAPGTTQKTGTISDVRTGTAADTGLETASETQTQVQTTTITDTATKRATQTAETGRPAAGRPPVYYGWKKKKLSELTEEEKEGAIAWKQGFGWWVIIPPLYDEETAIYTLKPPSKYGIRVAPNMKSAFSTIQQTEGKVPDVISFDRLGIVKATITRPPRQPGARTGAIKFTQTSKANQKVKNKRVGKYYVAGRMVSRHPIGR